MRKCIDFLKKSPVITGMVGVAIAFGGIRILTISDGSLLKKTVLRVLLFLSMSVFIYLISREKSFENCHTTTGYVVKWSLLGMISSIILFPLHFSSGNTLAADWPVQLILAIILCIFIGLFEETAFRVLINDAILYKFRNSKYVFVWIAIISSFVFGSVHVLGADFSTVSAFVSALLKIIQTGLFGFCLLILYWKTRNIWGIALAHALFDGLSIVPEAMLNDTSDIGSADLYVNSGSIGMIGLAGLIAVLTVAAVIIWIKVGRKIDFDEIRENW